MAPVSQGCGKGKPCEGCRVKSKANPALAFIRDTLDSSRCPVPRPAHVAAAAGDLAVRPAVFSLLTYEEKSFI